MASVEDVVLTRQFTAGRATFSVRCPSISIKNTVEEMFVDLPDGEVGNISSAVVLEKTEAGTFSTRVGDGPALVAQQLSGALTNVVGAVNRLALDADPGRLHLHCAALSLDGHGVLISAASGTGKTTLAAALVQSGWTYTSDEAIALSPGLAQAWGFPKPLTINPGGRWLLPDLAAACVATDDEDPWWVVPVSAVPAPIQNEVEPSVIVVLSIGPDGFTDAPSQSRALHPADAVVSLMNQSLDAERFGRTAVVEIARLAARCSCIELSVGPLDSGVSVLEELVSSQSQVHEVHELKRRTASEGQTWTVLDAVHSVVIGERAVVHDTLGGVIVALDEAATGIWQAIHGYAPSWFPADALRTPQTVSFLEQLAAHGLVSSGADAVPTGVA